MGEPLGYDLRVTVRFRDHSTLLYDHGDAAGMAEG